MEEKKDYKYLLLLKNEREQEKKTSEILKKQGNVKEYLIRAITYYEEQFEREKEKKETMDFLKEEMVIDVVSDASTETILFAELPVNVQLKVTYTEPGLKGDTATNATKPATVETGATVMVPLFVEQDDVIKIDTRTGEYLSRV